MICDSFKNDKVKIKTSSLGEHCSINKKNLLRIENGKVVHASSQNDVNNRNVWYLKKITKPNKHNDDTEQYINSIYQCGYACEGALRAMRDNKIKKTKHSDHYDQRMTNAAYTLNYQKRRVHVRDLQKFECDGVAYDRFHFDIPKTIKHLTSGIGNHGSKDRRFVAQNDSTVEGIILDHFDRIKDEDFQRLSSCYIKSAACHDAYHDGMTTIFDEIQKKLKHCKYNVPKCFVSLVKKDYIVVYLNYVDDKVKCCGLKNFPGSDDPNKEVDYEELCNDKNKYFDYYYVTPNAVYKVDHELVHNRVNLIEKGGMYDKNGKWENMGFREALVKHAKKKCFDKCDFKEFYDYKKKQEKEKSGNLNNLKTFQEKLQEYY